MKLAGLFTGENQIADTGKTQVNTVRNDTVNRQIQAMIPGQTIQGEVVSKNGNEVQIRLSDDMVLQAKLDQNMNLEVGKNMTFEVRNNGKALVLSPLFTNVATDANVLKALDMASLPLNGTTISLTQQMMEAGLSIDRNTLQQVYREVNMFPTAQTSDIVNLHKLQMPVNESNVTQMASYRNLTHQLVTGLNNVLDAVPEMFSQMMESGNTEGAVKLYQQLVSLAQEIPSEGTMNPVSGENGQTAVFVDDSQVTGIMGNMQSQEVSADGNGAQGNPLRGPGNPVTGANLSGELVMDIPMPGQSGESVSGTNTAGGDSTAASLTEAIRAALDANVIIDSAVAGEGASTSTGALGNTGMSAQVTQQFQNLLNQLAANPGSQSILAQINKLWQENGGKDMLEPLMQFFKQQWTITPEEVADPEQVEGLYNRLDKQLKSLAQTLESSGQSASTAYKAVTNLTQNLDFLQQVNQLYTYVQLPLRLQQGEAHGDLYVYTNKKHLAAKDGQISALLHLDMEHLGPVDVYVSMMSEKVNTKFYLQDDDMLDFMMEHMDILTERLEKRGYQCSYEMQVREQEEEATNSIQKLLQQENHVPLAEYAFDVRT